MKTLQLQSDSLEVCKAERGEVSVFLCKVCQPVDDSGQLQEKQAFNDANQGVQLILHRGLQTANFDL